MRLPLLTPSAPLSFNLPASAPANASSLTAKSTHLLPRLLLVGAARREPSDRSYDLALHSSVTAPCRACPSTTFLNGLRRLATIFATGASGADWRLLMNLLRQFQRHSGSQRLIVAISATLSLAGRVYCPPNLSKMAFGRPSKVYYAPDKPSKLLTTTGLPGHSTSLRSPRMFTTILLTASRSPYAN